MKKPASVTITPSRAMTAENRLTAFFSQVILLSAMMAVMNATATRTFFHLFRHTFFSFRQFFFSFRRRPSPAIWVRWP